jgi:hypothetical protein
MCAPKAQEALWYGKRIGLGKGGVMSALGQKQTFAAQKSMSALPPTATAKADSRKRSCLLYPRLEVTFVAIETGVLIGEIENSSGPLGGRSIKFRGGLKSLCKPVRQRQQLRRHGLGCVKQQGIPGAEKHFIAPALTPSLLHNPLSVVSGPDDPHRSTEYGHNPGIVVTRL